MITTPPLFQAGRLSRGRFENFEPRECFNKLTNTDKTKLGHRGHSPEQALNLYAGSGTGDEC
jgi:hypothetical protein